MIKTDDFPQADILIQVGKVAEAVFLGNQTDEKIEEFIGLDSGGRQGRYYRKAAEILGLIINHHNSSCLTPLGVEYSKITTKGGKFDFLARCLLENTIFNDALKYILKYRPNEKKLLAWFCNYYPGAKSTATRRFSTFLSYLKDTNLITITDGVYHITKYEGLLLKETTEDIDGLFGNKIKKGLIDMSEPSQKANINYEVDSQKMERANHIHWNLIAAKSDYLTKLGCTAMGNKHIDLYTKANSDVLLYEMKSISEANFISQIRKGLSQLYEYRYIFSTPSALLCIVTNTKVSTKNKWIIDYLAVDRLIAYEWTDDFKTFYCDEYSKTLLGKFAP